MKKIDFFGGLHGHFLELFLNVSVFEIDFDIERPMFNSSGACHNMITLFKNEYKPVIKCGHYSFSGVPFNKDDEVVRITCSADDMLIAVTNSFARAGEQSVLFDELEYNTLDKLNLNKTQNLQKLIIDMYGEHYSYSRRDLKQLFFGMFSDATLGENIYNNFDTTTDSFIEFPFRSFFDKIKFYEQCNKIAYHFNLNFYPTHALGDLYNQFIKLNQGWHSEQKCNQILNAILNYDEQAIDLNLVEESWLHYKLSKIYRCYDFEILDSKNTLTVALALEQWKHTCKH